jgi:hypothetical protein
MTRKQHNRNKRLGRVLTKTLIGFSEAAAGNLLGWTGAFVGLLKQGLAEFTPEVIRHLADRLPQPYVAPWLRLAEQQRKFGGF